MKIYYVYMCSFLSLLCSSLLPAQNIITFDDQGWNPDQSLTTSFTIGNFQFTGTQTFHTNYGYNFDVDSISVFFLFQNKNSDKITIESLNNAHFRLNSLAAYQVSQVSTDTLIIEGWDGSSLTHSASFAYDTVWTTLSLGFDNITKVVIRLDSAGEGGISDYNFDNFSYESIIPVELISFIGISEETDVKLEWTTSTELNNYGYDVERKDSASDWQKIGFVEGKGTTTLPHHYSYKDNSVANGVKYSYRLRQKDLDGSYVYSNEIEVTANLEPVAYSLSQNYPNPFNPVTTIDYKVPRESKITIKIFNIIGEEISTLVNESQAPGKYSIRFDGGKYPSGVYIYEMRGEGYVSRMKMMLLK